MEKVRGFAAGTVTATAPLMPGSVQSALDALMSESGDNCVSLVRSILKVKARREIGLLQEWRAGRSIPRQKSGLEFLQKIERHFELPHGYFAKIISEFHPAYRSSPNHLNAFHVEFNFQMQLHKDSSTSLALAVRLGKEVPRIATITHWKTGKCIPRKRASAVLLERIERHYGLPNEHFSKLFVEPEAARKRALKNVPRSLHGVFCWHLPADFEQRTPMEREEIVQWITENVLGGTTDYGKYMSRATRDGFAIVFQKLEPSRRGRLKEGYVLHHSIGKGKVGGYGTITAPSALAAEMKSLVDFKTTVLPPVGYHRDLRWGTQTSEKTVRDCGLLFGALVAAPLSASEGRGVSPDKLTFGLLSFPSVWDWYLHWRQRRRGFFAMSERTQLYMAKSLLRTRTGWIRQHPELAAKLRPIDGLLTSAQIAKAKKNWPKTCDQAYEYVVDRIPEMRQVARLHRDPFEAIIPVLEADSPMGEYRKIADEVLRLTPDEKQHPLQAALSSRDYLMIRLCMHLGVRPRNLRELLVCPKGKRYRSISELEELRRGEIRWDEGEKSWNVFLPALAFKNSRSSFFGGRPYRLALPDLEGLYAKLDAYIERHRQTLLNGFPDPKTFFVRSAKSSRRTTSYDLFGFYSAWRYVIQRYGIYNPYTGRGAVKGLLPHGPHSVRDVIATHVLKQTNSYELASFAIQDTVEAVIKHYARLLPHEKTARAAELLNRVWLLEPSQLDDDVGLYSVLTQHNV